MEYSKFAKYYDNFYKNKDYKKEVVFLEKILEGKKAILDVGCGTGIHMALLEQKQYIIDGVDLNQEMLNIARERVKGNLYQQNMLHLSIDKKYDAIISMFAVINHLKDIDQLVSVLRNFKEHLNDNGIIVIDLHNPQSSGKKCDKIGDYKRTMIWDYNKENRIEKSKILFELDGKKEETYHEFKIFDLEDIKKACISAGLKVVNCYENYTFKQGNQTSKNIQFYITNE